jgi:hypothetical protein
MAIDYTQPIGQVRLLTSDLTEGDFLLEDDVITGYLALNSDNVRRAAADALDAIASSETLVSKAIRTQDLATDGAKVADSLRKHAATLRAQADDADDDGFVFEIVPPATGCRPELTEYPSVWGL